jgi:hypothetical protein
MWNALCNFFKLLRMIEICTIETNDLGKTLWHFGQNYKIVWESCVFVMKHMNLDKMKMH